MRRRTWSHSGLSLLLALSMSAIVSAPLWHQSHDVQTEKVADAAHTHTSPISFCDAPTSAPEAECAVCVTKRLLSESRTGQAVDGITPPGGSRSLAEVFHQAASGERASPPARGPPLS